MSLSTTSQQWSFTSDGSRTPCSPGCLGCLHQALTRATLHGGSCITGSRPWRPRAGRFTGRWCSAQWLQTPQPPPCCPLRTPVQAARPQGPRREAPQPPQSPETCLVFSLKKKKIQEQPPNESRMPTSFGFFLTCHYFTFLDVQTFQEAQVLHTSPEGLQ